MSTPSELWYPSPLQRGGPGCLQGDSGPQEVRRIRVRPAASMNSAMSPAVVQAQRSFYQRGTASSKEEFFDTNEDLSESLEDVKGHRDVTQSLEAGGGHRALQHTEQKVQKVAPSAAHSPGVGLAEANASVRILGATSSLPSPGAAQHARTSTHARTHTHTHTRTNTHTHTHTQTQTHTYMYIAT